MDELTLLRNQSAPRDQALVDALGRRFEPVSGFLVYGVLYAWLVAAPIAAWAAVRSTMALGGRAHHWAAEPETILAGVGLAAFALAFWPFARWFRRRRAQARRLFGEGTFIEGRVAKVVRIRRLLSQRGILTRVTLDVHTPEGAKTVALSVAGHAPDLVPGSVIPVLVRPGAQRTAAFVGGRALAAG